MRARPWFGYVFLTVALFAGGYFYYTAHAVCRIPINYKIGTIDPRFHLTFDEARSAISDAESLWENATGDNLFTYNATSGMPVNFIYDDRQARADSEAALKQELDQKQQLSEKVKTQYDDLMTQYYLLKQKYADQSSAYEKALAAHNAEVQKWNDAGGAPQDVYQQLQDEQAALVTKQRSLNSVAYQLNGLVQKLNQLGDKGNGIVSSYNDTVKTYNSTVGEGGEFTQGLYKGNEINIYEYTSPDELRIVLAHELGHSLGLGHVDDPTAIMASSTGKQSLATGITVADLAEFKNVCGQSPFARVRLW